MTRWDQIMLWEQRNMRRHPDHDAELYRHAQMRILKSLAFGLAMTILAAVIYSHG